MPATRLLPPSAPYSALARARRVPGAIAHTTAAWRALAVVHAATGASKADGLGRLGRLYARGAPRPASDAERLLVARTWHAVDRAARLYPARVACLHRAAATVYLLRRRGVPAQLVVGVRNAPFAAHAWVELDGHVVGTDHDRTAPASYTVLTRV